MAFSTVKANDFLPKSEAIVTNLRWKSKELQNLFRYSAISDEIKSLVWSAVKLPCKVEFFGSRVIGVASEESDLDVFVEIDGKTYSMYPPARNGRHYDHFNKLQSAVMLSDKWRYKDSAKMTAVPVIFTVYKPMNLDCDINILNGLGVENSKLIAHLFEIQPAAVSLVHFIRQWLKSQGFEGFKGYLITLLVVFFLQNKNYLPTSENVKRGVYPRVIINDFECQFAAIRSLGSYGCLKLYDYKSLRRSFFEFYGGFDYTSVMSTVSGGTYNVRAYTSRFSKFMVKGVLIAGPCNEGKNCGICDPHEKSRFVDLCKSSSSYLSNVDV